MAAKATILRQLGDNALLLPSAVNDGLAANGRLKYYFALLQAVKAHVLAPSASTPVLRADREAGAVTDASLDEAVAASVLVSGGLVSYRAAGRLRQALLDDLEAMIEPLQLAPECAAHAAAYRTRLSSLETPLQRWTDEAFPLDDVDAVTRIGGDTDTLHRLVMDLHRELNTLQSSIARETIDGARTYGLDTRDTRLVRAFMRGLNETAPLKFDHPGLDTTATRVGDRLLIQNDLGTTDAHVIVIAVAGLTATVTYTDVHRSRTRFLKTMMKQWPVVWQDSVRAPGADYDLCIGIIDVSDEAALQRYLSYLGSRLVFLIDWNKARKALSLLMSKDDAIDVLRWAADANVGHRAFLQVGEAALRSAFERTVHPQLRYGVRLDQIIGPAAVRGFVQAVLRIASDGLRANRTSRLIGDQVEAELVSHLESVNGTMLNLAVDHAGLVVAIGDRVQRALGCARSSDASAEAARAAMLAKKWETTADGLVQQAHAFADRRADPVLSRLLVDGDAAADALEDAAFLLTALPSPQGLAAAASLLPLSEAVCASTREYVRCLECARQLPRSATRSDLEAVLVAVDRLLLLEHEVDGLERSAQVSLVLECSDFRQLHVLSRIAQAFESAVDVLRGCSLAIRRFALRDAAVLP